MKRWILALVIFAVCTSTLLAQISLDVSLVTMVATVTDTNGKHVPQLGPSDFVVIEDGVEQKISIVERSEDLPLSIGVLLDTSISMRTKIQTATKAIERFLKSLDKNDDMFLMTFAAKPNLEQNFTNDRNKIAKALRDPKLSNQTALYDAVEQAILKVRDGKHAKKAILLVTDGQDTVSRIHLDQAMEDVRRSRVLLYCLGIGANAGFQSTTPTQPQGGPSSRGGGRGGSQTPTIVLPGGIQIPLPGPTRFQFPNGGGPQGGGPPLPMGGMDSADMRVLNRLAEASGAKAFLVTTGNSRNSSMDAVLDEISAELRSQYTIGYYPNHSVNDGKWHQVVVRTKNSRYEVRSRKEYFGGQRDK